MEKRDVSLMTEGRIGLSIQNWPQELDFSFPNFRLYDFYEEWSNITYLFKTLN